jgi:spore coat protein U-like protein
MKAQNALVPALVAAALALSATAAKAGSVTATASVSVTILAPVTLQATQGLDFGAVAKPGNAGANTVTLDPASSSVTVTGTGDGARAAGSVSPAKFSLVGDAGVTYSTTQSLSFDQPGLTRVSVSMPVAGNGALGVIPPSGVQELRFGGAFDLTAATPVQAYSGSLAVTVNYN